MSSFLNRPDKVNVDSFSDPNLDSSPNAPYFSQFTNQLKEPILNVKGIQLLRANFVNPSLPLNDFNGQLIFVYSRSTSASSIPLDGSTFKIVRLLPSWYVPAAAFTAYTKNKYFNNGAELVAALNTAASTGGDSTTYNPTWVANDVTFTYDTTTRRISFQGNIASNFYAPVPFDHPAMAAFLSGSNRPKMNAPGFSGSYAVALPQPYNNNTLMNSRLGFALTYNNRGVFWSSSSIQGCATSIGTPTASGTAVEADSFPILIGSQNINVFCSVINGSSTDTNSNRNLIATIPLENGPLGVNSYTLTSVEKPARSVVNDIYLLQFNFTDDFGNPFYFYNNMNINLELNIYY